MMTGEGEKLIIGMSHFGSLPGDPKFDKAVTLDSIAGDMLLDVKALAAGGADAVMFSNEASQPWMLKNGNETMTAMAYILGRIRRQISLPFGVHVIWDAEATINLATAVGADFAWEAYQGAYCSDYGIWDTNAGAYIRQLKKHRIKLLCEVFPESAVPIRKNCSGGVRNSACRPYGVCIAGIKPGIPPALEFLEQHKHEHCRLLVSTGMNIDNITNYLKVADGAIIGSAFKKDGELFSGVDYQRVRCFVDLVKKIGYN